MYAERLLAAPRRTALRASVTRSAGRLTVTRSVRMCRRLPGAEDLLGRPGRRSAADGAPRCGERCARERAHVPSAGACAARVTRRYARVEHGWVHGTRRPDGP